MNCPVAVSLLGRGLCASERVVRLEHSGERKASALADLHPSDRTRRAQSRDGDPRREPAGLRWLRRLFHRLWGRLGWLWGLRQDDPRSISGIRDLTGQQLVELRQQGIHASESMAGIER